MKILVGIPAFNEEKNIGSIIIKLEKMVDGVIVCNDGSSDLTGIIAEKLGATVINHPKNLGYGGAINSIFTKAKEMDADILVTFDADGQHSSNLLIKYIEYLKNGFDLVLGVRPYSARVSELLFSFYTRLKFGWKDPLCGMKGYSMRLYKNQGYFDSFNSVGTELAFFALLHKYKYIQLSIPIMKRHSKSRFSPSFLANMQILMALLVKLLKMKTLLLTLSF